MFCLIIEKFEIDITPNILKRLLKEPIYNQGRKLFRDNNENEGNSKKKILMNINPNDSTNVAFRNKESVVEGNEFTDFNKNNIKWD